MSNTNAEMTKSIIVGLRGEKKLTEIPASFLDIRDVILVAVQKYGNQLADAPD